MRSQLRRHAAAAGALGLLLTLVACTGDDAGAQPNPDDPPASPPGPTSLPPAGDLGPGRGIERYTEQTPEWEDCDGGFECATVQVPLDYDDLSGDTVGLLVARRPADDPDARIGSLLVNPGGPGASGVAYARGFSASVGSTVLAAYDLVGFDPRGVGSSEPVECLGTEELDEFIASEGSPDSDAEVDEVLGQLHGFGAACQRAQPDLLAHVSTVEVARDLDVLRAVLGDDRLHYFGASYGTYIGSVYAELFPDRVGRLVLDGAVDPTLSKTEMDLQQAVGFETALHAYAADCVSKERCPLGDDADAGVERIRQLLDDLDAEPLATDDPDRPLTQALGTAGLSFPMYLEAFWPGLSLALEDAFEGDGALLLNLADVSTSRTSSGYADNRVQAIYAVNCLDDPSVATVEEVRASIPDFEQAAPVFGEGAAWTRLACTDWPARAAHPVPEIDAAGAAPILVVGTTRDPATPLIWAEALAEQLDSGVLLTRDGDGHTAYGMGNECIDDAIEGYLVDGVVPADGTAC